MKETSGVMKKKTAMLQARMRAILIAKELSWARMPFSCRRSASSQPALAAHNKCLHNNNNNLQVCQPMLGTVSYPSSECQHVLTM